VFDATFGSTTFLDMYGDDALKLIRECKRYDDTLPPYNDDLVRSVQREIKHAFQDLMDSYEQQNSGLSQLAAAETVSMLANTLCIRRNKRCLLAYHNHRLLLLKDIVWDMRAEGGGNRGAPADIRSNVSAQENEFYKGYAKLVTDYKRYYADIVDVTTTMQPPKTLWIMVRAIKDLEFVANDGNKIVLMKGRQQMVKRSDVEKFISQGYLIHIG
jgi:GINS complex subunit 1